MFAFRWLYNLRVAHKLAMLLAPFIVAFICLMAWNNYANKAISEINQQVDGSYKMRGDVTASALIALHYGSAIESQILDTIRFQREELQSMLDRMGESNEWIENASNADYVNSYTEIVQQIRRILKLEDKISGGALEEAALLGDMVATYNQRLQAHIDNLSQQRQTLRNDLDTLSAIVLLLGIALSVMMWYWITRSLLKQLGGDPKYAVAIAEKIADGDLASAVDTKMNDRSSLIFAMKRMSERLAEICNNVRKATDSIATTSQQLSTGISDLAQRTEKQNSSLADTTASMNKLTVTVKQNANYAKQANQLATNASEVATKGGQVVGQVVQTMSSISASSNKIVDIIGVIEGIAFQTNILALNAAVEAARAGEQGRGFAVVANEVRNLAQRSAAAAKEIKALIGDSVNQVSMGSAQVDQAGTTMNEIVSAVKQATDLMSEIAAASLEQSTGIEQVNSAIAQIDDVTQQNAALVDKAAAATKFLEEQADTLTEAVSMFKLDKSRFHTQPSVPKPAIAQAATSGLTTTHKARKLPATKASGDSDWKEF